MDARYNCGGRWTVVAARHPDQEPRIEWCQDHGEVRVNGQVMRTEQGMITPEVQEELDDSRAMELLQKHFWSRMARPVPVEEQQREDGRWIKVEFRAIRSVPTDQFVWVQA